MEIDEGDFLASNREQFQNEERANKARDLDIGGSERQALEKTAALFQDSESDRNKEQSNCSRREETGARGVAPIEHGRQDHGDVVEIS